MTKRELIALAVRAGLGREDDLAHAGETLRNLSSGKTYVAKSGGSQVLGEGRGLQAIAKACPSITPNVHVCEQSEAGTSFMISDFVDLGRTNSTSMQTLAQKMANEMHNPAKHAEQSKFGFDVPTHCGATEQDNAWEKDWMIFYRDRRLGGILAQIKEKRGEPAKELLELGKAIQEDVCPSLLSHFEPAPRPVILHGDLWSGNVRSNAETGEPVIFDCSSYFGHNEADFGISHMFGAFDDRFYDTYHKILPRSQPNYNERMQLYELYHHLNHYLMFGGSYQSGALRIMRSLLEWHKRT